MTEPQSRAGQRLGFNIDRLTDGQVPGFGFFKFEHESCIIAAGSFETIIGHVRKISANTKN